MMIFEKIVFVFFVYLLTALDVKRHTDIQSRGQSPSHVKAAIARGIVGVIFLMIFAFWQQIFVWYWMLAFMFINVWFFFNLGRNWVMGDKWYYLGVDSDPEEDSVIDTLIKRYLPEEVAMTFLAFAAVISLVVFVIYGHLEWSEVVI